jgi:hypothetical protein
VVVALAFTALPIHTVGQEPLEIPIPAGERLRVFLDCQSPGCDFDYFRTDITYVDWVRDREDAGLHVLVTSEATGGGGRLFHLDFVGRAAFENLVYRHDFDTPDWFSTDEMRRALSRRLQTGLLPYLGGTEVFDWIEVRHTSPDEVFMFEPPDEERDDPWRGWVFNLGVDGSFGGETQTRSWSYSGSVSAGRTTEASRIRFSAAKSRNEDEFDFADETFTSASERYQAALSMVRSLGDHWGLGVRGQVWSSTFENMDRGIRASAGVEASFFPYSEFTRRSLVAQYSFGWNSFDYQEETLFDKIEEKILDHRATLSLELLQEWGDVSVAVGASQYLHDPDMYSFTTSGSFSIRIFRGFSLDLFGSYDSVHDQLNIQKGGASEEEVLLRRKALATSYYAYASIGFSYRFGSMFNNAVNPRLGSFR